MNELAQPSPSPHRLRTWFHELATRFLFFKLNSVAIAEAANIHGEGLDVSGEAFTKAIEATRHAKKLASPDDADEQALLEAFVEGVIAQTKVMQRIGETGQPNDPQQRREALENPTKGSIESPQSSGSDAIEIEPNPPSQVTEKPRRGRPLGSKTKQRTNLDREATRGGE